MTTNNPETHNPPAFPIADRDQASFGMSLRDYFAAKATEADIEAHRWEQDALNQTRYARTREEAKFVYADQMLAARQKGSQP